MPRSKNDELRRRLYEMVWSIPLVRLARQIGIKPKQLRELCEQWRINMPGNTYWQKHRLGLPVEREPLQSFPRWLKVRVPDEILAWSSARDTAEESQEPVPLLHPLVEKTRVTLLSGDRDSRQILCAQRGTYFDLRVTRRTFDRALRFLDAIVRESEARGHQAAIVNGERCWTEVIVFGVHLPLSIRERVFELYQIPRQYVRKDKNAKEPELRAAWKFEPIEVAASGELSVYSFRVWTDRHQSLEKRVGEIVCDLETEAKRQLAKRTERQNQRAPGLTELALSLRTFAAETRGKLPSPREMKERLRSLAEMAEHLAETFERARIPVPTPPPSRETVYVTVKSDDPPGWAWNAIRRNRSS